MTHFETLGKRANDSLKHYLQTPYLSLFNLPKKCQPVTLLKSLGGADNRHSIFEAAKGKERTVWAKGNICFTPTTVQVQITNIGSISNIPNLHHTIESSGG